MRITILTLIVRAIKYSSHLLSNHKGNGQVSALTAGTVVAVGLTGAGMVATKYVTDRQKEINQAEQMKLNEDAARKLKDKVTLRKDSSSGMWASDWQVKNNGCPGGAPYCLSGPDIGTSSQIAIQPTEIRNLSSVDVDKLFNNIDSSTQSLLNTSSASDGALINFTISGYQAPQGGVKGWLTAQTADGMIAEISLDALPPPPTCNLTSQRVGVTSDCTVSLTITGEVNAGPYNPLNLDSGTNTRNCSVSSSTIFNATVTGVGGSNSCDVTQDRVADPQCGIFAVTRTSPTSDQCQVNLTATEPTVVSQYLVNGAPKIASYSCPKYSPTQFSGSLQGVNGTVVSCGQAPAPEAAPTCQSFTVTRKENEPGKCLASMTSQGTIIERWINEVPQAGAGPWTVNCSTLSNTSFSARIKSAGGETTCNPISIEAVPPTSCTFTASRITNDRCRITVRSSGGPMNRDYPRLGYRYDMFGPYARTEVAWQPEQSLSLANGIASLDVPCDSMRTNYFAAGGFGPGDAQRKNCTSSDPGHIGGGVVRILPNASECRFTANRDPQNLGSCNVRVSRQGGPFNEGFPLLSYIREGGSWVTQQRLSQWDGTTGTYSTACVTDSDFQFVVDAHGPGNPIGYRCTPESVDPALMVAGNALRVTRVLPPKCSSLAASRLSPTSDQCRLTFNLAADSGPLASPRPAPQIQKDRSLASVSNNLGWSGNTWEGNIYCPTQSAGEFSATITGLSGTSATCAAPQIAPVPPTQCNFSASRKAGAPGTCVVSVSSTGGPLSTGYPILGHATDGAWQAQRAISPWNGSSSSMEIPCDVATTHTLVTTVKGPGDNQEKPCSGGNQWGQIVIGPSQLPTCGDPATDNATCLASQPAHLCGCYNHTEARSRGRAKLKDGTEIELVNAPASVSGFKIWKEAGGNRMLKPSGLWTSQNDWQKTLNRNGTAFTSSYFTHLDKIYDRICPPSTFIDRYRMTEPNYCLYYTKSDLLPVLRLDEYQASGIEGEDWLSWDWARPTSGGGSTASYYEGNLKPCADLGMRIPTVYEIANENPTTRRSRPQSGGLPSDAMPIWGTTNPRVMGNWPQSSYWTATANAASPPNQRMFWSASDYAAFNSSYEPMRQRVVCFLPDNAPPANYPPPVCAGATANRTTSTSTTCNVTLTKGATSGPISQVLVNGQAGAGSWNGNTWTGTTSCAASGASITGALIDITGRQSTCGATVPASLQTCQINGQFVGVNGDLACNRAWCNIWRDRSLTLFLPEDATDINLRATTGGVDDWSPRISINGNRLIWTDERHSPPPRNLTFNHDISSWFRPGNNTVYVGSWNKHTYWSIYFYMTGSYKSSGCTHRFP